MAKASTKPSKGTTILEFDTDAIKRREREVAKERVRPLKVSVKDGLRCGLLPGRPRRVAEVQEIGRAVDGRRGERGVCRDFCHGYLALTLMVLVRLAERVAFVAAGAFVGATRGLKSPMRMLSTALPPVPPTSASTSIATLAASPWPTGTVR